MRFFKRKRCKKILQGFSLVLCHGPLASSEVGGNSRNDEEHNSSFPNREAAPSNPNLRGGSSQDIFSSFVPVELSIKFRNLQDASRTPNVTPPSNTFSTFKPDAPQTSNPNLGGRNMFVSSNASRTPNQDGSGTPPSSTSTTFKPDAPQTSNPNLGGRNMFVSSNASRPLNQDGFSTPPSSTSTTFKPDAPQTSNPNLGGRNMFVSSNASRTPNQDGSGPPPSNAFMSTPQNPIASKQSNSNLKGGSFGNACTSLHRQPKNQRVTSLELDKLDKLLSDLSSYSSTPSDASSPGFPPMSSTTKVPSASGTPAPGQAASSTPKVPSASGTPAPGQAASSTPKVPSASGTPAPGQAASSTPKVPSASGTPAPGQAASSTPKVASYSRTRAPGQAASLTPKVASDSTTPAPGQAASLTPKTRTPAPGQAASLTPKTRTPAPGQAASSEDQPSREGLEISSSTVPIVPSGTLVPIVHHNPAGGPERIEANGSVEERIVVSSTSTPASQTLSTRRGDDRNQRIGCRVLLRRSFLIGFTAALACFVALLLVVGSTKPSPS
ncbi:mucin-2-like [Condylostylus longicornis]|uniref:mucin-2-like n=1 Tax=Condylostylus longicornis TaxID=2530218 RepID=UPI00244DA9A3|nr:mucin-2-like [Condylostylus longicornis]